MTRKVERRVVASRPEPVLASPSAMDGLGIEIWAAVADAFRRLRGRQAHDLWLSQARPHSMRRGLFTLDVGDRSAKAVLDERYRGDLEEIILEITGSPVRVRTRVPDEPAPPAAPGSAVTVASPHVPDRSEPSGVAAHGRFVVTPCNGLAASAVDRLVDGATPGFHALFLHGPPSCGKTALAAHALRRLAELDPEFDPLVLSGEALSIDVGRAARSGNFGQLQRGWAGRRVIVLDEAHRLRNRHSTQAIVVSLIAPALERGARVLVLSRHAPDAIFALGPRIRSHFLAGLVVPMKEPDVAAREAVLAQVAADAPALVDPEVPRELARRCPGTLGDALAVLRRAAEDCHAESRPLMAVDLEGRLAPPSRGDQMLVRLIDLVCAETGLSGERIRSREKSRDVAQARHLCVYVASASIGLSSRQICRSLRQRSPSIVAYARRAVERRRASEPEFDRLVHEIQARLAGAQRDFAW